MNEAVLTGHYQKRGFSQEVTQQAIQFVRALETHLQAAGSSLETASVDEIRTYIRLLMKQEGFSLEHLLALARYFYLTGRNEIYIYFTSLLGGEGVVESISERLAESVGASKAERVLEGLSIRLSAANPLTFPLSPRLYGALESNLPEETVQCVLAGNNHGIPAAAFEEAKTLFSASASMDEFLLAYHKKQVAELQHHCDTNTVWYEQSITQEVVDFVSANQEIQSAVREGDVLYTTKIPYDPAQYLAETDPVKKRYYACHCPFVREAILAGSPAVSENWCYCSGGFVKYPYKVILGRPLRVKMLQSVLRGDPVCRFAIDIAEA
jgi:predicted hydrocarbon binding protein